MDDPDHRKRVFRPSTGSPLYGVNPLGPDELLCQFERLIDRFRRYYEMVVQPDGRVRSAGHLRHQKDQAPTDKLSQTLRRASEGVGDGKCYKTVCREISNILKSVTNIQRRMQVRSRHEVLQMLQNLQEGPIKMKRYFEVQLGAKVSGATEMLIPVVEQSIEIKRQASFDAQAEMVRKTALKMVEVQTNYFEKIALECEACISRVEREPSYLKGVLVTHRSDVNSCVDSDELTSIHTLGN